MYAAEVRDTSNLLRARQSCLLRANLVHPEFGLRSNQSGQPRAAGMEALPAGSAFRRGHHAPELVPQSRLTNEQLRRRAAMPQGEHTSDSCSGDAAQRGRTLGKVRPLNASSNLLIGGLGGDQRRTCVYLKLVLGDRDSEMTDS